MTEPYWLSHVREYLHGANVESYLKDHDIGHYELTVNGADRHGGVEWTYQSESEHPRRYVRLSIIPDPSGARGTLELIAGASDGHRYATRRIALMQVETTALDKELPQQWLYGAFHEAERISLTERDAQFPDLVTQQHK
ncbi:hypothetical protein AB0I68_24805 [Streptomyces sp. NPDC050448]|uniref:hypothetical protein n=1 Tax=Streptomyces sp. NPDC050448 TaxID=3155404 RepID=UPI00341EA2B0